MSSALLPSLQICYAPALREETARRNIFTNALALTRATRGKGIIISSGARSAFELRGPYDVINMATLFGLSEQDAKVSSHHPACLYMRSVITAVNLHQNSQASRHASSGNMLLLDA